MDLEFRIALDSNPNARLAESTIQSAVQQVMLDAEVGGALSRLQEVIYAKVNRATEPGAKADSAEMEGVDNYNSHSFSAHRSSVTAYTSGGGSSGSAAHQVAADHHDLAAQAASNAADKASHPDTKKDLQTAAKFHKAQAAAHRAASATHKRGNTQPYTPVYSNSY